ncbi:hypothetical protein SMACR_08257 [Sordaria macrospora]|uniref:Biogenesis of lysosome-related organelles complex 1 subunit KXD1 n=2 Tax=Sordaria macrospora TaxID=5147 RepID=F7W9Y1_SORMK|nr:uncharacterized protein SMAC_08257 [Sordaria macrospora k-hell]KAA8631241.1 hypothetical protein SMACR_08257 [Sordaria macrospora]KAH7635858.1 hypothetical protein B0T09DRAFT_251971 [Sordaria sp. MPI-SDFR-AT-0083]WPJ64329.1 hypothetical protein SMAC4_08257 [Sordaria macrospora]CCC05248.1 unnamed protein product [Sordaria macrospora k-hell]
MSSNYSTQYYAATGALPIPSGKGQYPTYPAYYNSNDSNYSVSPPEESDPSVTSGSGMGQSTYSVPVSTYAGSSQGDYESAGSASGIDLNEYMQDRFADTFSPIPLDRLTVEQAKISGGLNAKHREVLELQAKAQARLARTRARFAQGLEDAQAVRKDLEWTQKKVTSLSAKAAKKHPKEYAKSRARHPSPEAY